MITTTPFVLVKHPLMKDALSSTIQLVQHYVTKVCTLRWTGDRAIQLYFHYQFSKTKQERMGSCALNIQTLQYLDMD